ncbi:MAG: glycoside hydrolase family 2 protein, partial [Candidatus Hodarchaeota archaeon]
MIFIKKVEEISLDGEWNLIQKEKDINISIKVPGSIFEALIINDIIEDPFYGLNEHKVSWVFETEWNCELEFDVNSEFLKFHNILIHFNGIDTFADIYLNERQIGSTSNMFVAYQYNVKHLLKEKNNLLRVILKSP